MQGPILGATAAAFLGLALVFYLLLQEKEANGELQQAVERAEAANQRQIDARRALADRTAEILAQVSVERGAAQDASEALTALRAEHETDIEAMNRRLAAATENLDDEEIVCAMQPVPVELIDSLLEDARDCRYSATGALTGVNVPGNTCEPPGAVPD